RRMRGEQSHATRTDGVTARSSDHGGHRAPRERVFENLLSVASLLVRKRALWPRWLEFLLSDDVGGAGGDAERWIACGEANQDAEVDAQQLVGVAAGEPQDSPAVGSRWNGIAHRIHVPVDFADHLEIVGQRAGDRQAE